MVKYSHAWSMFIYGQVWLCVVKYIYGMVMHGKGKMGNIWKLNCLEWTRTNLSALRSYARMCLFQSQASSQDYQIK